MKGVPIVTSLSSERPGQPTIPFVGLSEALVLAAVRSSGVPLQRVRPALEVLSRDSSASSTPWRRTASTVTAPRSSLTTPKVHLTPTRHWSRSW